MEVSILLAVVYIIGIVCIGIMKKIQPDDKIYPAWVVMICVILTSFLVWYVSLVQVY